MVTDAPLSAQPKHITIFLYCVIVKKMVVEMVNTHSTTATKVRASTCQQLAVASAFAFYPRLYVRRPNDPAYLRTHESE